MNTKQLIVKGMANVMELQTQIKFANIYSKFYNEEHTPSDIGKLIETIRNNKHLITDTAAQLLLQIPLCALESQVEVKNSLAWAN